MKNILIPLVLVSILLSGIVLAQSFSITVDKEARYFAGQDSTATLLVNNDGADGWFSIIIHGYPAKWINSEGYSVFVNRGSSQDVTISVEPSIDAVPGSYEYEFIITKLGTEERVKKSVVFEIVQLAPAIVKDLSVSCKACRTTVDVSGEVMNLDVQRRVLTLTLTLGTEQKILEFDLAPKKIERFFETFYLKGLKPGQHQVIAELSFEDNIVFKDSEILSIPTSESVIYEQEETVNVLGRFVTITAFNDGNTEQIATMNSGITGAWFAIYSGPEPSEKAGSEFTWSAVISPGETREIVFSELYWPTYLILTIIAGIGALIYFQYSALTISKIVPRRGKEMSVSLHIKNRIREMDTVVVRDIIPSKFKITSKFATLKPVIRKIANGTELIWKIGRMRSNEERVVHYKIRAAGEFKTTHLPPAKVRAKRANKIIERRSNFVKITRESKKPERIVPVKVEK